METQALPVIAGITIYTDAQGRFNLNELHRASGFSSSKQPSNWTRLDSTKALYDELIDSYNSSDLMSLPIIKTEGRDGGTFAHKLLAISYAGWISPSFQLKVNQVFADYQSGKLQPVQDDDENLLAKAVLVAQKQIDHKNQVIQQQQQQIEDSRPKVEFYEQVTETSQEVSVRDAAKMLGTGEKRLFTFLREYGYLMSREPDRNLPYQRYIDQDFFTVRLKSFEHPKEGKKTYRKAFITGKGLVRLAKHLREIEVRQKLDQHLGLIA